MAARAAPYVRVDLAIARSGAIEERAKANQRASGGAVPQKSAEPMHFPLPKVLAASQGPRRLILPSFAANSLPKKTAFWLFLLLLPATHCQPTKSPRS
jgi:hypothetical protein